jgi:hypothetical protein
MAGKSSGISSTGYQVIGLLDGCESNSAHAGMQADALAAGTLSKA